MNSNLSNVVQLILVGSLIVFSIILRLVFDSSYFIAGLPFVIFLFFLFIHEQRKNQLTVKLSGFIFLVISITLLLLLLSADQSEYCRKNNFEPVECFAT
jgi:hypothetical protein